MLALIPWFKLAAFRLPIPFLEMAIPIQPFGVLAAVAIIAGSRVAAWRARSCGVSTELTAQFVATTVPSGLASGMLLNVIFYEPDQLQAMGRAVVSWFGGGPALPFPYPGLSSFGGFFGALLAALVFRRRRSVSLLVMADLMCFALPFAWMFARMGCFLVHDHPGIVSHFFLAVADYNHRGQPRHDLGLYEVLWSACAIPILLVLARKHRPWGFYTAFVSLAYAAVRFALDFLRAPVQEGGDVRQLGLTPAQYAALVLMLIGIAVAVRTLRGPQATLLLGPATQRGAGAFQGDPRTGHDLGS
jgi:phosphatidylglycerol:prolipoprotein diacylglycerol transferase